MKKGCSPYPYCPLVASSYPADVVVSIPGLQNSYPAFLAASMSSFGKVVSSSVFSSEVDAAAISFCIAATDDEGCAAGWEAVDDVGMDGRTGVDESKSSIL